MVNNELFSNYYVAHLDILGARAEMKNEDNNEHFIKLKEIYENALIQAKSSIANYDEKEFFIKIFSDNILIAIELENNDINKIKLQKIINLVGLIQLNALRLGLLLRGGISLGTLKIEDVFIYGKALVEAVELEEDIAVYPRIILNPKLKNANNFVKQDSDGYFYVNSYYFSDGWSAKKIRDNLLVSLSKYKNNEKIKQKIMWSIVYHNEFCRKYINVDKYTEDLIITDEEIANATK